jgi:NCS1 family nucleobase:cation symporter-1
MWPAVFGLGLPVCIISFVGFFAGLAIKDSGGDPTVFLTEIGGLKYGIPALLFIILANVGTVLVGLFVTAVALRQVPSLQRRLSWKAAVTVSTIPSAIVLVAIPDQFFDNFPTFLAFCGVIFAPLTGIGIVDYFLLRKQRIDMRAVFVEGPGTPYHYWGGVNPAGVAAMVAGFVTYLVLLDPVHYTSHSPYEYIGASLPATVVAGAVFAVLTVAVRKAGKGGYERSEAAGRTDRVGTTTAAAAPPLVAAEKVR